MKNILNAIKENKLILIISLVTTFIFFHEQILGTSFFWDDFVEYVYPTQTFAARESGLFNIPFWNPYIYNGMPFFADIQVGFFYPFHRILNLFVSNDGTLPVGILQLIIIIHFIISQINTYILAKSLGISKEASIFSAISYSFSMILVVHVIHPMMLYHLVWFPLIFHFFRKGILDLNYKYSVISGLIFGFTMLSGHPQMTLYIAFFLFLYAIYTLIFERSNLIYKIITATLPIIIASGIFAVQFLPSSELAGLSQREENTYEFISEGSLQLKQAVTMILPEVFGKITGDPTANTNTFYLHIGEVFKTYHYWETAFYFGVITLILGIYALLVNFKDKKILFLFIVSIFALFFSFGSNFFLHKLFYNLPFFNTFRMPGRILFYLTLSFSLLAGFGLDKLNKKNFKLIYIPFSIVLIIIFLGMSDKFFNTDNVQQNIIDIISKSFNTSLIIVILSFGLIFLTNIKSIKKAYVILALASLSFIDLYLAGSEFNQSPINPKDKFQINNELKELFKIHPPNDIFRVNMRMYNPSYMALNRSQGMLDGIMLVEGYNPLLLQRPVPRLKDKEKIHDILNVKYEIGIDRQQNQPRFYERFDRYKHVWATNKVKIVNENNILNEISQTEDNLRYITWLEKTPNLSLTENDSLDFSFSMQKYQNDVLEIKTKSNTNSMMVLSEIFYPAWKAFIDGKETEIFRADFALRAIELPKGEHTVTFEYNSDKFKTGMTISVLTLLLSTMILSIKKFPIINKIK